MLQKYMRRPELIILGIILVIGLIFRLMTLKTYGSDLTLGSDDLMYQKCREFLETGMLTYHDPTKPTIHIMPGQVFLLASIFFIFGHGSLGVLCAKLVMIAFGIIISFLFWFSMLGVQMFAEFLDIESLKFVAGKTEAARAFILHTRF